MLVRMTGPATRVSRCVGPRANTTPRRSPHAARIVRPTFRFRVAEPSGLEPDGLRRLMSTDASPRLNAHQPMPPHARRNPAPAELLPQAGKVHDYPRFAFGLRPAHDRGPASSEGSGGAVRSPLAAQWKTAQSQNAALTCSASTRTSRHGGAALRAKRSRPASLSRRRRSH